MEFEKSHPFHFAVIHDDVNFIQQNFNLEKLQQTNEWGFSALDLARLLDKPACMQLLANTNAPVIKVLMQNHKIVEKIDADQFFKLFNVHWLSHLKFSSYQQLSKVMQNCPYTLSKSFKGKELRALAQSLLPQLKSGWHANVTIVPIDEEVGWGLMCNRNIPAGEYVGQYTGLVHTVSRFNKSSINPYCMHYPTKFWSWNYTVVDSWQQGGIMRFLNHSVRPNLQPVCLPVGSLLYTGFIAKCDIARGSLLTFDYGHDFWQ